VIDYNDLGFRTFTEIQRLTAANYRRWKGQQKSLTMEHAEELAAPRNRGSESDPSAEKSRPWSRLAMLPRPSMNATREQRFEEILIVANKLTDSIRIANEEARDSRRARPSRAECRTDLRVRRSRRSSVNGNSHRLRLPRRICDDARLRYEDIKAMFLGSWEHRLAEIATKHKAEKMNSVRETAREGRTRTRRREEEPGLLSATMPQTGRSGAIPFPPVPSTAATLPQGAALQNQLLIEPRGAFSAPSGGSQQTRIEKKQNELEGRGCVGEFGSKVIVLTRFSTP
jgi:hypothetical protein